MKEYDVVFNWIDQQGEKHMEMLIGVRSLTAARTSALAAKGDYPDAVAIEVEVIDGDLICECCNGSGKLADATKPITRDHVEWIPCDCCNGTGNESGKPTKTYLSEVL